MKAIEYERFAKCFGTLCEVWEREISPTLASVYFRILEPYPIEVVERAISEAIGRCRFFPKPAELLDLINGSNEDMEARGLLQATGVLQAVKRVGAYQTVVFADPVTAAVIQDGFGGWVKLCTDLSAKAEQWFLKDFARLYRAFHSQGRRYSGKLAGIIESQNSARGFLEYLPSPVMVGGDGNQQLLN